VQVDGIQSTNATRTLIDSAPLLDSEQLEVAFESARRMGLTTGSVFARRAHELSGKGHAGTAAIRRLLSHQRSGDAALQYRLEVKTARLLRSSTLPQPGRQHQVGKYSLDFAWLRRMFAVECEGYEVHGNRLAWKRDKRRTAALEALGWRLMFVSWDDVVRHSEQTLERIRLALL
jgi:very-short-patch-repair endonuclease